MQRPSPVFFDTIGCDPMRFDMARVDHQRRKIGILPRQRCEDTFENASLRPPFPAVVERLGGAIFRRRIEPAIASLSAENVSRQNPAIIHARNTTRFGRQQRSDFVELCFREPEIRRHETSQISYLESHRHL